jgi:hypothetical protein
LRIMGLSMEFLALFENQKLPYLEIEYCLIWKLNIALFESWFFLDLFCIVSTRLIWKLNIALFEPWCFFCIFLIVSTRLIWKLNIALFEPWCFFGNYFWKYSHALFETHIWPYLNPNVFAKSLKTWAKLAKFSKFAKNCQSYQNSRKL